MARKKLVIIDGNSLANRAFYAIQADLSTKAGERTNAVYGFANMLLRLVEEERPDFLAVAFDKAAPTFRHLEFEGYKATRKGMPDELASQMPLVKELVEAFRVPVLEIDGYEADDIIGTVTRMAEEAGCESLIVTGDRDTLQLVSPLTRALITKRGISEMEVFDEAAVRERFGVHPSQVPDLKGLAGDASDNIPGVPGIGEKTAVKLIQGMGGVEEILRNIDAIEPARARDLIREHAEQARLSRKLSVIDRNVPIRFELEMCRLEGPDYEKLAELFERLEFRSLLRRLESKMPAEARASSAAARGRAGSPGKTGAVARTGSPGAQSLFREEELGAGRLGEAAGHLACEEDAEAADDEARRSSAGGGVGASASDRGGPVTVADLDGVRSLARDLADAKDFVFDLVAADPDPMRSGIVGMAFAIPDGRAFYVPCGHSCLGAPAFDERAVLDILRPVFEDDRISKVCHDAKPKTIHLFRRGVRLEGLYFDTMIGAYLVSPERKSDLTHVIREELGEDVWPVEALFSRTGRGGLPRTVAEAEPDAVRDAVCAGLVRLPRLREGLTKKLMDFGMQKLFCSVEMPLVTVLAEMEMAGVAVDPEGLRRLSRDMAFRMAELEREIYELAGEEFNINSPRQLGHILFEKLGLPAVKKTKTGYSTDAEVLEELSSRHRIAAKLVEYREIAKLKGTYADALASLINPTTGRIHTTFNQTVTATGRLSSSDPNLQNIPVRKEEGRRIRAVFVPGGANRLMLSADYSQIELRVLAHFSRDEELVASFRRDEDIHARTAASVFGVDIRDVTPEMRSRAKAVNFGIVYGISDFGLAKGLGISRKEAALFITTYFRHYRGVKRYMDDVVEAARRVGYVTTLLNRRRYLPDLNSRNVPARKFAERTAMNTPIQGTAADIIKLAMVTVHRELRKRGLASKMVLQVHDELVFEVPEAELGEVSALAREAMESAVALDVPLKVDLKAGPNWLDLREVGATNV
ncbi:MAG: DNA polymerase I [Firmicutes bacterium]|jgi:DNA polymerase-1|nr:DNA polymerase I [Bacillota bacterium]MDH7496761.1 DNA polymerase I [Bacillota bacterium]